MRGLNANKISCIDVGNPDSFLNDIFITIDIDWACDDVLHDTINLLENAGVSATWFVTHDTPILNRLRANKNFELGIHPNFNNLLSGEGGIDFRKIIDNLLEIVPEAISARSHSLTFNAHILSYFKEVGIKYDCNQYIPNYSGIEINPWLHFNGMVRVPHFWEDDCAFSGSLDYGLDNLILLNGLKVFDFHPIHIYLNSENIERYNCAKRFLDLPKELLNLRFAGHGTRDFFTMLIRK